MLIDDERARHGEQELGRPGDVVGRAQRGTARRSGSWSNSSSRRSTRSPCGGWPIASDALELTQEVFLHVLRRIGQLREPERFAGWLRQVAVRMAINRATRRVAPPSVEIGCPRRGLSQPGDEPLDQLISRERAERLWEALGRLKSLDREALDAFYIRGHSLIEIAEELGVPLGTVKRRLHTARKRLKRLARGLRRRRPGMDRRPDVGLRRRWRRARARRRRCGKRDGLVMSVTSRLTRVFRRGGRIAQSLGISSPWSLRGRFASSLRGRRQDVTRSFSLK